MRFLADESVEAPVIDFLRGAGHDVEAIAEDEPGAEDPYVLRRAARSRRILLTNDKDFAELAFLQRRASSGIVLLRLPKLRSRSKAARLAEVIRSEGEKLRNVMTVIGTHALRRRSFPDRG